jgi:hypothetical protein
MPQSSMLKFKLISATGIHATPYRIKAEGGRLGGYGNRETFTIESKVPAKGGDFANCPCR